MNVRFFTGIACCTLLVGCQQDPKVTGHLDALHAEYRTLEDDYFELKYHYLAAKAELDELRGQPAQTIGVTNGAADETPEIDFGGPSIEFGTPVDPMELNQPDGAQLQIRDPQVMKAVALSPDLTIIQPAADNLPPEPLDTVVTHIVINPYLTAGLDLDRKPGDDGVSIVIEPRNADNQFVPVAGAVRIAVIDPAEAGDAAYVAEWNFDARQAKRRLKRGSRERGIHFKLPWPNKPPKHSELRVFVRYQSEEGELRDEEDLYAALPGEFSHRWTPKSPGQSLSVVSPSPPDFETGATSAALTRVGEQEEASALQSLQPTPKQTRRPEWRPFR